MERCGEVRRVAVSALLSFLMALGSLGIEGCGETDSHPDSRPDLCPPLGTMDCTISAVVPGWQPENVTIPVNGEGPANFSFAPIGAAPVGVRRIPLPDPAFVSAACAAPSPGRRTRVGPPRAFRSIPRDGPGLNIH
jgi:hypothetical protein